ncbi:helix-turn-helix domain-containing protein [Ruicaihuangia caeni]|uniref:helix-turn-helix domain-containing protein n=1 Tax=Ruicaihuangia caeni TaxID=3042517 RepID=UPI00338FFA2A
MRRAAGPAGGPERGREEPQDQENEFDALLVGRRIRQLRLDRGMTLEALGEAIGRAASQVSVLENGKREPRLGDLQRVARALGVTLEALLSREAPSRRAALEIALERVQRGPLFAALNIEPLAVRRSLSDAAIETILALHDELDRVNRERAATPEEARRANTELREQMRRQDNYFPELEAEAAKLLEAVGHRAGPLSQRVAADLAARLGFTLHYVGDLPTSTRSVSDLAHRRIYLPARSTEDPRGEVLRALARHVLDVREPRDYAQFLAQRVQTNYLAAALMVPERGAVAFLSEAKQRRELSVEDLRDAFAVTYETAAHRFTNLATRHFGIPVHFIKVHESGSISKAYANDQAQFPTDALGAVEGQLVCRQWAARQVFAVEDRLSPYHQYTDKPNGSYWCTSSIQSSRHGVFSVSVGTPFAHTKWFRGRDTTNRHSSTCPDPQCCHRPSSALTERWANAALPDARLESSLLAAVPVDAFTGVDHIEVYEFLERHAPTERAASINRSTGQPLP